MPFILCPSCGKCDLVPLALSECILEHLFAKGHLDGCSLAPYPGGLSFVLCNDCKLPIGNQGPPIESGSTASLAEPLPDACRALNSHVKMVGGETVRVTKSIKCYTGHFAYVAELSGVDVCLLHDWLSPSVRTPRPRQDANNISETSDESPETSGHEKKWWQIWR